jgi:uncharacterized protein (TIGR03435 family)
MTGSKARLTTTLVVQIALGIFAAPLRAQQSGTSHSFEVASVRANEADRKNGSFEFLPGGDRLVVRNYYLGMIIMRAYNLDEPQLPSNVPLFLKKFDIDAKTDHPVSRSEMMRMLQHLLEDRFKLSLHKETKEVPGYVLVVAKGGPKLRQHKDEQPTDCKMRRGNDGGLIYENCSISYFASYRLVAGIAGLSSLLGNHSFIADETGLKGNYDFELMASWEVGGNPIEGIAPRVVNPDAPSVFAAVEKQLGLKLEAKRIPVEFYYVSHIEKPSEN